MSKNLENQLRILEAEKQIRDFVNKSDQEQFYYDIVSFMTDEELECIVQKKSQELKDEKEKILKKGIDGAFNNGWNDRLLLKIIDGPTNQVIYENQKEFFDKFESAENLLDFDFIGGGIDKDNYDNTDWYALKPFMEDINWAFTPKPFEKCWTKSTYILFYVERSSPYNIKVRLFYPTAHSGLGRLDDIDLEITKEGD